jgi:hypothetical protein
MRKVPDSVSFTSGVRFVPIIGEQGVHRVLQIALRVAGDVAGERREANSSKGAVSGAASDLRSNAGKRDRQLETTC